ncbi:MAG: ergothioneine biosynthesis protein EgtB [Actinomycetales bacterium]|nr:ergothioneine biosynthesis protein EgtB [Actinomycetales bacterium]
MHDDAQRYHDVRQYTEALAAPLSPEDQTVQSMPDVSPTKWHRAHVTWFFETFILADRDPDFRPFHDGYWTLFNSYYESKGPRYPRPDRGLISRPGAAEVTDYRLDVDKRMIDLLLTLGEDLESDFAALLDLGIHHEQQHQELLLMDIKHVLSVNPLRPSAYPEGAHHVDRLTAAQEWLEMAGGIVGLGNDANGFAFDNEWPRHEVLLRPFRIARRPVTNREWLEFMQDGGYNRHELWLSDGWARVNAEGWRSPLYWIDDAGQWLQHTLSGTRPVNLDEPVVHVSHYEADAFAAWAGARLPTEAEWEVAATASVLEHADDQVWQWTSSAYLPYPGFHAAPGAVGEYNGKFMSSQMVLRGGSCVTPPGHARPTYRNFFPPHSRWAFSGLRLAADA